MAFIRITKIHKGAKGTWKYNGKSYKELDMDFAREIGLLTYSRWLWNVKEGDTLIVPFRLLDEIREKGKGVFEFQIEHPKYANQTLYSDTNPFEVVEWKSETCVVLRPMDTADYCGEMGEYCETYISRPDWPTFTVREHKNGGLYESGSRCCPYILAEKPHYRRDPSF
jgi:hypothetical protein